MSPFKSPQMFSFMFQLSFNLQLKQKAPLFCGLSRGDVVIAALWCCLVLCEHCSPCLPAVSPSFPFLTPLWLPGFCLDLKKKNTCVQIPNIDWVLGARLCPSQCPACVKSCHCLWLSGALPGSEVCTLVHTGRAQQGL